MLGRTGGINSFSLLRCYTNAQAVPGHPCSPASMRSRRLSSRCAPALLALRKPWGPCATQSLVSGLILARRAASSSVSPMATASAILATTSGVPRQ